MILLYQELKKIPRKKMSLKLTGIFNPIQISKALKRAIKTYKADF